MARIIDLTELPGVYGARLLMEAGHDVIRVEPRQGDELRRMGPFLGGTVDLEHGSYHHFLNSGKRSLTLEVGNPSGRAVWLALVKSADAIVAEVPGPLDVTDVQEANPSLVVTLVEDGDPELCLFAQTGLASIAGRPDRPPLLLGGHLAYAVPGLFASTATSLALFGRQRGGGGQLVRVSVRQVFESLMEQAMIEYTFTGKGTERRGSRGTITATSGALPCKDGYWLLSLIHRDVGWTQLMDWMKDPVLLADPSLVDEAERHKKRDFILDRIEQWSRRFTRAELVAEAQRRHIPASPISTPADLINDPQLIARGFLQEVEHSELGKFMFPVGAIAAVTGGQARLAPRLGEHNAEILAELGFSESDHQALLACGAM